MNYYALYFCVQFLKFIYKIVKGEINKKIEFQITWQFIILCSPFGFQEMKLLAEVDQPGSLIDNYVTKLSFVLSRKAASLVGLQARLARFQHRLKEQEILSRKRVPRQ